MGEKSPLVLAAEALADRAKALAGAAEQTVSARGILLLAAKISILSEVAAATFDDRRMRYAKRICIEHRYDPDMMVTKEFPAAIAGIMGANYTIAPLEDCWRWGPLWVHIYNRLPSLGGIEDETELHDIQLWSGSCAKCGATREEFDDCIADKFSCPGPCTEPECLKAMNHMEIWRHPDGTRFIRRTPGPPDEDAAFTEWKSVAQK